MDRRKEGSMVFWDMIRFLNSELCLEMKETQSHCQTLECLKETASLFSPRGK